MSRREHTSRTHDSQEPSPLTPRRTVTHTLPAGLASRLRLFAFEHRVHESAIIECALLQFLASGEGDDVAATMREDGHGLRPG